MVSSICCLSLWFENLEIQNCSSFVDMMNFTSTHAALALDIWSFRICKIVTHCLKLKSMTEFDFIINYSWQNSNQKPKDLFSFFFFQMYMLNCLSPAWFCCRYLQKIINQLFLEVVHSVMTWLTRCRKKFKKLLSMFTEVDYALFSGFTVNWLITSLNIERGRSNKISILIAT